MDGLGYPQYYAQGGDWGSVIVQQMARLFPMHCLAIHINMPTPYKPGGGTFRSDPDAMKKLTTVDRQKMAKMVSFSKFGVGYQVCPSLWAVL
jgi:hypothetical protein